MTIKEFILGPKKDALVHNIDMQKIISNYNKMHARITELTNIINSLPTTKLVNISGILGMKEKIVPIERDDAVVALDTEEYLMLKEELASMRSRIVDIAKENSILRKTNAELHKELAIRNNRITILESMSANNAEYIDVSPLLDIKI